MVDFLDVFASLTLLTFSTMTLLSGLFTAYFGAGKSRKIGQGLSIAGLLGLLVFVALTWGFPAGAQQWAPVDVLAGVIAVLGAIVGSAVAVTIFLVAIMRA